MVLESFSVNFLSSEEMRSTICVMGYFLKTWCDGMWFSRIEVDEFCQLGSRLWFVRCACSSLSMVGQIPVILRLFHFHTLQAVVTCLNLESRHFSEADSVFAVPQKWNLLTTFHFLLAFLIALFALDCVLSILFRNAQFLSLKIGKCEWIRYACDGKIRIFQVMEAQLCRICAD